MNEPSAWTDPAYQDAYWEYLRGDWHQLAYDTIRLKFPDPSTKVVLQQAFRNPQEWVGYTLSGAEGLELDLHEYHAFGEDWNGLAAQPNGWEENLKATCEYGPSNVATQTLPTFIGEWSLAVCDCQEFLDGGYANPYVPPNAEASTCAYYNGNFSTYPQDCRDFMKDFMLAQMDAGELNKGFFFWTAKVEQNAGPEWDYLQLLAEGIAPADLCTRDTYTCP